MAALLPHVATALAISDADGTDNKNIIQGAVMSLFDENGDAVILYDDENGSNGSTTKQTDATGRVTVYVTAGEYEERTNNINPRPIVVGGKNITSYATTSDLEATRPSKTGQRAENRERANAQYVLAPAGYVAQTGDVVAANGRVWSIQINGVIYHEWFGKNYDALNFAVQRAGELKCKVYTSTEIDFEGNTLSIPSGVSITGIGQPLWSNARVEVNGSLGSSSALTVEASKGDRQLTVSSVSGIQEGEWLRVVSTLNANSEDAGDLQLGDRTSDNSVLAEFVQVQSIAGNVLTLHEPILWNYPLSSSANTPSGLTGSLVFPISFHEGSKIENIKMVGTDADYIFRGYLTKDCILKDCVIENGNAGSVEWRYCYNSGAIGGLFHNTQYSSSSAQTIPFKFRTCQECYIEGRAEVIGGHQGIDATYDVGDATLYGGPSISCRVENIVAKSQPTDAITSHPGCYNTRIINNTVYADGNGIRIRSRCDQVVGNTLYGSSNSSAGVFAASVILEGSVIENNTIVNFQSGILQSDDNDAFVSDNFNQIIVKGNTTIGCGYGFSCNFSNPTSLLTNTVVQGNLWVGNSERNLTRGVTLGGYSNGLTIKDNTSINATEAGVRYFANIINLTIKDNECLNLDPAGYGVRGASSSVFITDLTTFPDGESSANLSVRNNSQVGGIDYTGIVRNGDCYRLPSPTGYQGFSVPISDRELPALQMQTMNIYLDNSTSPPELRAKVNNGTSVFDVLISQLT